MTEEINGFDYTDVLLKASELVVEEGRWRQHTWFVANGQQIDRVTAAKWDAAGVHVSICMLGAVSLAADRLGVPENVAQGARSRLSWFLRKFRGCGWSAAWNDEPGRTADEVAEALREAAERPA